jgi:hypothetical protein
MHTLAPLPYTFNVQNTSHLIQQLHQTPLTPHSRLAFLDISNMYANIPVKETKQIFNDIMTHNQTPLDAKTEILTWYDIVTSQNYFTNGTNISIQKDGLAMGAPSSGILSEIFLQKLENTKPIDIANELQLITYHRYVDDILIVYDIRHTDINTITTKFNEMHPNLHFTHETELTNTINYLDVTINRRNNHVDIAICRKPTYTDAIIPYTSNHPPAHKYAAIRYMYNRLESYQLNNAHYSQEYNTIQNILYNNKFPLQTHIRLQRKNTKTLQQLNHNHKTKNGQSSHTLENKPI